MKESMPYPKSLKELAYYAAQDLQDLGLPEDLAVYLAYRMIEAARHNIGGQQIYIPKAQRFYVAARNSEIVKRFTGKNYAQLSQEVNLTTRQLYNIVSQARGGKKPQTE